MSQPRRESDSEDEDFRSRRGPYLNGHAKWLLGVVALTILGLAGWTLKQLDETVRVTRENNVEIKVLATKVGAVERRLERLEK